MVGIPSSKGCATCRRRKIRCGQERPGCTQCLKAKRTCEGYERYPVFINRTENGIVVRKHLEETRSYSPLSDDNNLVKTAQESNVVCWYWKQHADGNNSWVGHAINIASPTAALQEALIALSLTRYGRLNSDQAVVLRGQRAYSKTLGLVQRALYDESSMWLDDTLAAIRAMTMYELFEVTTNDPSAWQQHIAGITRLMQLRGPERHQTPMAQAVLEDARYGLMVRALTERKASPFGEPAWQMKWDDPEQKLCDLGFRLAAILEQTDREVYDTVACRELSRSLDALYSEALEPLITLNLLACKLLLGFVAVPLGIETAEQRTLLADRILALLPTVLNDSVGQRCIFPLTCAAWEFRSNPEKQSQVQAMFDQVAQIKKVRFASKYYEARTIVPNIAKR